VRGNDLPASEASRTHIRVFSRHQRPPARSMRVPTLTKGFRPMTKTGDLLMATARKASLLPALVAGSAFGCAHEGGAVAPAPNAAAAQADAAAQAEAGGPLY